ncbi:hypothetical protein E3N88_32538 [Mikania micrantha]|uniref:FAR1 domain-containing protein n=1 Tax=Mikania micrantha TaxID=192012 RepID=A0A5N6MBC5_9ASTR|nr:hypothetical protein E3N88_32538 [Mikania micrantha]
MHVILYVITGCLIEESRVGLERISPTSGKKYYKLDVPLSSKPIIAMCFTSIEHAFDFYQNYAKKCGFIARKDSQYCIGKVVKLKHFVCSKEGHKPFRDLIKNDYNTEKGKQIKSRNRPTQRTGCLAHIDLKSDDVSPEDFDREWLSIMDDYELSNSEWFGYMFEIRDMWIPSFYRDEPMSGLMRTTSRSESENHSFGQVSNCQLTLLEFFTHFDTAIEVFFFDVQEEIYDSIHSCLSVCTSQSGDYTRIDIKDLKAKGGGYLQKDEKAIRILEKSSSDEKKDDRIMRNSIGMLNGLLIADIRSNISNLRELLDDNGEGAEAAKDYTVSQLMMNKEMDNGVEELLKVTIDKMKKKRDGVDEIKKF